MPPLPGDSAQKRDQLEGGQRNGSQPLPQGLLPDTLGSGHALRSRGTVLAAGRAPLENVSRKTPLRHAGPSVAAARRLCCGGWCWCGARLSQRASFCSQGRGMAPGPCGFKLSCALGCVG